MDKTPQLPAHTVEPLFTATEIAERVSLLGQEISLDYARTEEPLLLVGVLKGATLFLADLARAIDRTVEFDFIAITSYGAGTHSSGEVRVLKDTDAAVAGKHVIIVEDILDTGLTLSHSGLIENLHLRLAASVRVCVLLNKPSRRLVPIDVHYCGFMIEDCFVVGYGMDYADRYRNLPYIGVVRFQEEVD